MIFLIESKILINSLICGTLPVPIDQTGSYAKIIFFKLVFLLMELKICLFKTEIVFLSFFCFKVSPIQKITFNLFAKADSIYSLINFSVSPLDLFSECPKITYFAPAELIMRALTDPVKAPLKFL